MKLSTKDSLNLLAFLIPGIGFLFTINIPISNPEWWMTFEIKFFMTVLCFSLFGFGLISLIQKYFKK